MSRFTSILSTLALVPTSLALATPALASTVSDVVANFGAEVDPKVSYDLNCDGKVGIPDLRIANRVTTAHSHPDFNPIKAVTDIDNFGADLADLGKAFPYEADLNGDCKVGLPDLATVQAPSSVVGAEEELINILQVMADDWGTTGDSPADLNCDGVVGLPDVHLVVKMANARRATHFDRMTAVKKGWGSEPGDANYHPAADDGDCIIGMPDLLDASAEAAS